MSVNVGLAIVSIVREIPPPAVPIAFAPDLAQGFLRLILSTLPTVVRGKAAIR